MKIIRNDSIKLKNNDTANFISDNRVYEVIAIEYGFYRVFDNLGEPVLVPAYIFDIFDNRMGHDWIIVMDDQDIAYLGPEEFEQRYFFESFFDYDDEVTHKMLQFITEKNLQVYCNLCDAPQRPWLGDNLP